MKFLNNQNVENNNTQSIKIGTKIFALVGFCLILLGILAGVSIWQMKKIGTEIESIAERYLPLTVALTNITIHQLEQAINFERSIRISKVTEEYSESKAEFNKAFSAFKKLSNKIEKEFVEINIIAQKTIETAVLLEDRNKFQNVALKINDFATDHKDFDVISLQVFNLIEKNQTKQGLILLPQIEKMEEKLDHGLEELLFVLEGFTVDAAIKAEIHEQFALKLLVAISAFSLLIGVVSAILVVRRSITRPLGEIVKGLVALNSGDMSVVVKVYSHDEIGSVAKAYVTFKDNMIKNKELKAKHENQKLKAEQDKEKSLHLLADNFETSVVSIVEAVALAALSLNTTAETMSDVAEKTSNQSTAVSSASSQTSSNVQTVAAASEEMSSSILEINHQVMLASTSIKKAVLDVERTSNQIDNLVGTTNKINGVINLISDIAEQTNLLALNATIESARAGDAGKGFAVVASEVKELANQTSKATEQIGEQVAEVQAATKDAVISIAGIGKIIKQVDETSTLIAAAMEEQGSATLEISKNVQEAASGTEDITKNIIEVSNASLEAGMMSNQVLSASGELSKQSDILKSEITVFLEHLRKGPADRRTTLNADFKGTDRRGNRSGAAEHIGNMSDRVMNFAQAK